MRHEKQKKIIVLGEDNINQRYLLKAHEHTCCEIHSIFYCSHDIKSPYFLLIFIFYLPFDWLYLQYNSIVIFLDTNLLGKLDA